MDLLANACSTRSPIPYKEKSKTKKFQPTEIKLVWVEHQSHNSCHYSLQLPDQIDPPNPNT